MSGEFDSGPMERPILFKGPMVRAILDGTKTQTRRLVKPMRWKGWTWVMDPDDWFPDPGGTIWGPGPYVKIAGWGPGCKVGDPEGMTRWRVHCPYGHPAHGDSLWVRETWRPEELESCLDGIRYRADNGFQSIDDAAEAAERWIDVNDSPKRGRWRPSIHMPRWASRITLKITRLRVQRLNDLSEADARAEGVGSVEEFRSLWDGLNKTPWKSNPWVWVVEFSRIGK